MLLQYFINYNLPKGWYVSGSPIVTTNWAASHARGVANWDLSCPTHEARVVVRPTSN